MLPNRLLIPLVGLCLGLAVTSSWAAEPASASAAARTPRDVVESLHAVLIDCMKGDCGPGFEDRYARILANLDQTFDLPFMARVSVGKAWKTLSAEERRAFVDLSRDLSAAKYADNFDGYGGQHFETLGEEPAGRGTILVKTEFVQPDDENVTFDYRLRKSETGWRIIDVTLDGKVSEITLRRAEYGSVIEREGFPKLVEALEKQIVKHSRE